MARRWSNGISKGWHAPGCARWCSTPPGSKSNSQPPWVTARAGVCRSSYSTEGRDHGGALETAGGIRKALPWLAPRGDEAFWVVSGDIFMPGFEFDAALAAAFAASTDLGLLWLVPNPGFHERRRLQPGRHTTAPRRGGCAARLDLRQRGAAAPGAGGIAATRPARARSAHCCSTPLRPTVWPAACSTAPWHNLGTPAQLEALNTAA